MKDLKDGCYCVFYILRVVGIFNILIKVRDDLINGSFFKLVVVLKLK